MPSVQNDRRQLSSGQNLHAAIGAENIPPECIQGYEILTAEDVVEVLKHEEDPQRIMQLVLAIEMTFLDELKQRWRAHCTGMVDEGRRVETVPFEEYVLDLRFQFVQAACLVFAGKADTYADAWEQVCGTANAVALEAVCAISAALGNSVSRKNPR